MPRLIIIGAGGHARVVADVALAIGYTDIAFLDDKFPALASVLDFPVIGRLADLPGSTRANDAVFVGIGDNARRLTAMAEVALAGRNLVMLAHPSSVVSRFAEIGAGTIVMPLAVVNVGTIVGQGVILNTACSVDHDCVLADGVHVSPGANISGGVSIGSGTWIGTGASVREYVTIGAHAMIGGGAFVGAGVPDGARVGGVPARPLGAPRQG